MAGMVLVQGDASINSACTVTAVRADQVYLCGHPFLSLGDIQFPWLAAASSPRSRPNSLPQKSSTSAAPIGTITGDHLTAVTGKLGAAPAMIPLDLTRWSPAPIRKAKNTPFRAGQSSQAHAAP